jgi:sporulation protein YlmC with PRC-barrel domain
MYGFARCPHNTPPKLRAGIHIVCPPECSYPSGNQYAQVDSIPTIRNRRTKMSQLQSFSNSPVKASSIIGTNVVNPNGDSLGEVKEVVIDPRTGKIAYAVVSFGGFLGMGEKLFAIPFNAFEYSPTKGYVLDVSKERLKDAPGFDPDHWPSMADEKWNRDVYKYYGHLPYWE